MHAKAQDEVRNRGGAREEVDADNAEHLSPILRAPHNSLIKPPMAFSSGRLCLLNRGKVCDGRQAINPNRSRLSQASVSHKPTCVNMSPHFVGVHCQRSKFRLGYLWFT